MSGGEAFDGGGDPGDPEEGKGPQKPRYHKLDNHQTHGEEGEEGEPWLLSYADMVTLLMCFFILFFSLDKTKGGISDPQRIKNRLESLIGLDSSMLTSHSKASTAAQTREAKSAAEKKEAKTAEVKKKVNEDLKKFSKETKIVFSLATPSPGVIEITFLNSNFFDSGQASLTAQGESMIRKVTPRLRSLDDRTMIEIEGHTDADPVTGGKYPSNWELSSARASAVARQLQAGGIKPSFLKVTGFGEFRPIVKEKDLSGFVDATAKKLNRRVVLRIIMPDDEEEAAGKIKPVEPDAPAKAGVGAAKARP